MLSNMKINLSGIIITIILFTACQKTTTETGEESTNPPNVVFIICDDLNDIAVNKAGHPQAKMPNVEKLAGRGVNFVNAYSNNPICAPSRASMLAGIYPHNSQYFGIRHETKYYRASPVLDSAKTFAEYFLENGYNIYGTGKIFHNGPKEWPSDNFGVPQSFSPFPWDGKKRLPGRPDSLGFLPHPNKPAPLQTSWESTFGRLSDIPHYKPDPENDVPGYKGWMSFGLPFKYESAGNRDLMPDEKNTQYAKKIIGQNHEKPFFLAIGYTTTHTPYYAPDNYFDRFPLEELQIAKIKEHDLADVAPTLAAGEGTSNNNYGFRRYNELMEAGREEMLKKWTQAYLACAALVDDQVGEVLEALEDSPHKDNTIIVFTSDHGFHMGEKEFLFKNSVWHESLHIPMIFAGPGIEAGKSVQQPVSLVDLFPTFIDLCDLPEHPNEQTNQAPLDGNSLVPFLIQDGEKKYTGPDIEVCVVQGPVKTNQHDSTSVNIQNYIAISEDYKYVITWKGNEEFYDLKNDPYEWNNLADHPDVAEEKQRIKAKLLKILPTHYEVPG